MPEKELYLYVTAPAEFHLAEIDGEEGISDLFHYRLKLRSEDGNVDFKMLVGQKITATIIQYNGTERHINGVVTRFMQGDFDGKMTTYYAEIRPWLWELTLTTNSKIFQNLSVLDIISEVFSDMGFTDFSVKTIGTYKPREYCVQYQETAFAFVSRLMEDEGIFYFFEHEDGKHTLVIADDMDAHQPCPGLAYARMRYASLESKTDDNFITRCTLEQQMIHTKYAVDDYNFETPESDLLTSVDGKEKGKFRVYEYPGKFANSGEGEAISDKRIEMCELPQKLLKGQGFCRAFIAGYKFELQEHERGDVNDSYILRRISLRADQDGYVNTFEAFPANVPFRPPRTATKPRIPGTQTAVVVGKKGEEIWPDEYGRVKVQFHWDQEGKKDENSSCWVRVTQMWAGKNWGTLFIPRIGAEVIVSFLEGDPDRPIITGTVYNASQVVPYSQPGDKTKSTIKSDSSLGGGGFNEIRFEDKKGSEEIFTHAQKDQNEVVENNMTTTVKANQTVSVIKNQTISVGGNRSKTVTGNRTNKVDGTHTETIKKDTQITVEEGKYSHKINTGTADYYVKSDVTQKYDATQKSTVAKEIEITSKNNHIHITAKTEIKLTVGKSVLTMKKDGTINLEGVNISVEGKDIAVDGKSSVSIHGGSVTSEADNDHTTKGNLVLSEGAATNTVKGGMIMLNP